MSGFDPRGVAAYHRLFCEESQTHAARAGVALQVGPRRREGPLSSTWTVDRTAGDAMVATTFEFLHWDDIARRHWHAGYLRLYLLAFKTYWYWIVKCDILARVRRIARWNFVTGIAPGIVLFLLPLLAFLCGWGGHAAGRTLSPGSPWLAATLAVLGFAAVIGVGGWLERFFSLGWLLRTYGFVLDYSLGDVPELDERVACFAARIAAYVAASDDDEILIVGHSVGANVAVSVLGRALAIDPGLAGRSGNVGFLTLGGSIPMQGLLPWAQTFRDELARLAANADLPWVDISAPQDLASFALLNPVAVSGVTIEGEAPPRPLVVSGVFKEVLTPETYASASWDMFRMHFQYLMAGEREGVNNYFAVTTDAAAFRGRFTSPACAPASE